MEPKTLPEYIAQAITLIEEVKNSPPRDGVNALYNDEITALATMIVVVTNSGEKENYVEIINTIKVACATLFLRGFLAGYRFDQDTPTVKEHPEWLD